ncbi:MAG: MFS transporter [Zoogloeaceae bacterium]|jgi:predicted MFS family arabinose efflux permease|nr:MFS transporter [Zoogloeaceae bacterium]
MNRISPDRLTTAERRIGIGLAAIFGLRMLGLFLILPVFALHAGDIKGGDNLLLVGLALGAYGGTQACLQIVWGAASDRLGRKPVIIAGLLLFALGSFMAALAPDMYWMIAGRVIQGAGAISAAVTALAADLTREECRARMMGMIGASIGLVFAVSMVAAPLLFNWIGMRGIFWLTGFLALAAIAVLIRVVPVAPPPIPGPPVAIAAVLREPQLMRLNFGVFVLHLTQMALWVLAPTLLVEAGHLPGGAHWQVYLPAVLISFALMTPAVIAAERKRRMKHVFIGAIVLLAVVLAGFRLAGDSLATLFLWITLFFVAFNVLEAIQPSLISRIAPPHAKGKALGVYNTLQALGLFAGGIVGGALAERLGNGAVFIFCALAVMLWLTLACGIHPPPPRSAPPLQNATA